ncbi:hypothetical protein B0A52_05776 [Exophiala mesophila]|uniref:Uncharacterized protein n=1 Tax=Exophiala mesophila TaxID=212818 RepID=A0A438N2I2_EXOME|nr:hypothetical protein B0A52_05776 [Exophiala mesophila]
MVTEDTSPLGGRACAYNTELALVRESFLKGRYKKCAALCESLQPRDAYLWYYHATCHEFMGLSTHSLSSNKLRLLEIARDSLHLALQCLPLPFAITTRGQYQFPEGSPFGSQVSPVSRDQTCLKQFSPQTPSMLARGLPRTISSYSVLTDWEEPGTFMLVGPQPLPERDMKASSEVRRESPQHLRSISVLPPASPRKDHKARLSQSLSVKHNLAHELVPSPLFSRTRKSALGGPGADETTSRPLPALPFNHNAGFQIFGTRIKQIPRSAKMVDDTRKTGIQTLIARFEERLPLSDTASPTSTITHHQSSPYPSTPITPRFDMIRSAFKPHSTPNNVPRNSPSTPGSASLARLNIMLSSFRNEVRVQLSDVTAQIQKTERLQLEHCRKKTLGNCRLASFWSFEPAVDSQQSISAITTAGATATAIAAPDDRALPTQLPPQSNNAQILARKKRIEMLRADEWRVSKEKHGFKGQAYYDDLCARTNAELDQSLQRYKRAEESGCARHVTTSCDG